MMFSPISVALFMVAALGRSGQFAFGIRRKDAPTSHMALQTYFDDEKTLLQTSNVLLKKRSQPNAGEVSVVSRRQVSNPESFEGGFGDEPEPVVEAHNQGGAAESLSAFVPVELSKISASSAKELNELYGKVHHRVNPELLRELREKLHIKGHLHYPHMHVVNHKIVPAKNELTVAAFGKRRSMFSDDRIVITLVSFVLISFSSFLNFRRQKKGTKGLPSSHDLTHVIQVDNVGDERKLTVGDATVDTLSSIMGMGFLSLPYAMAQAGWIGALLIVFFCICSGFTATLLTQVMYQEVQKANVKGRRVTPGWGFILGAAYGPRAEWAVNVFLVVELWGYFLSGVVATALNLSQLVDDLSVSSAIGITVLTQFALTAVPMRTLSRLNVLSNFIFSGCIIMFIVTGFCLPVKAPASDFKMIKVDGLLAACGIIVFSPCSHSIYPSIMQRMEDPKQYTTCISRAYSIATSCYLLFAVAGYYLYGNAAQPSAVRNIGADLKLVALPDLGWMNYVAAFGMVMKMSGLQPLILTPLTSTIEDMLSGKVPQQILETLVAPIVLTLSAVVAVHFAHQMATLINLVGSIFCMSIAFILPVLCYWKLIQKKVDKPQSLLFTGLLMMGSTFAVLGLITAIDS